jgi:hypothetical protein
MQNKKRKHTNTTNDQLALPLNTYHEVSNTVAAALVAVLISPTIASGKSPARTRESSPRLSSQSTLPLKRGFDGFGAVPAACLGLFEDDLTYSFNKVQEGSDLQGVSSHLSERLQTSEDPRRCSLPELSKSLGGSGLATTKGNSNRARGS